MSEDLQRSRKLLIVSDTAMYRKGGEVFAFGPVVREIEAFPILFSGVTWIGFSKPEYDGDPAFKKVDSKYVTAIMLPKSGGDSFSKKIGVLLQVPNMIMVVWRQVANHAIIHTRAPSSPAFLAVVLSWLYKNKTWWNKYAGNWAQERPPFFYGLQIKLFKAARHTKVTINGSWPAQPHHCLSFENPTITKTDQQAGLENLAAKSYSSSFNFCFVGRLEKEKGLLVLLEAFKQLQAKERFGQLHIIGSGPLKQTCEQYAREYPSLIFHGSLSRQNLNDVYSKCHFLYLPSTASEGFPKVIAEGANYGCIPIVSKVSSIDHYLLHGKSGFLLKDLSFTADDLVAITHEAMEQNDLKNVALAAFDFSKKFSYDRYIKRIDEEIIHNKQVLLNLC